MTWFKRVKDFLETRMNWILLLLVLQVVFIDFGYLDPDLSVGAVGYVALFNLMIIVVFSFCLFT